MQMPATMLELDAEMVKHTQQAACRPDCGEGGQKTRDWPYCSMPRSLRIEIAVGISVDEIV
jgi:hypothetical protein